MRLGFDFRQHKRLFAFPLLAMAGIGVLMLPGALRLPHYRRTSVDGVANIRDAVSLCRRSGWQGWDLVSFAQQLVGYKFAVYSALNLWDPPGRAFSYGMGYCTQYNLALKQILDRLGFQTRAVFAGKTRFFDNEEWTMGHTWLRVTVNGETRDVCAGSVDNEPGQVNFIPFSPVYDDHPIILLLTHIGMIFFCGVLQWKALLSGREPPTWMYEERA